MRVYQAPLYRHPFTTSTLLLPHHAAEGGPIKLAATPRSTLKLRHTALLCCDPVPKLSPGPALTAGTEAQGLSRKHQCLCPLILLSYGHYS